MESKSFEQCKADIAKKHGLGSTLVTGHMAKYWDEAAELYKATSQPTERTFTEAEMITAMNQYYMKPFPHQQSPQEYLNQKGEQG